MQGQKGFDVVMSCNVSMFSPQAAGFFCCRQVPM